MQLHPEVMLSELQCLSGDLKKLIPNLKLQTNNIISLLEEKKIRNIYLVGSGDSYYAALSVEMLFNQVTGVSSMVMSSFSFLEYYLPFYSSNFTNDLVIAISASGNSPVTVECLELAKKRGFLTLVLTINNQADALKIADYHIISALENKRRSPGIRSYQANLLGLVLSAMAFGEQNTMKVKGHLENLSNDLNELPNIIDDGLKKISLLCDSLADKIKELESVVFLGSGPNYGTACFSAAKIIEASGVYARGQELEEWWHVDRFARPYDMPVFIMAPHGRAFQRAVEIGNAAVELGRNVYFLTYNGIGKSKTPGEAITFNEQIVEELTPFVFCTFSSYLGAFIAEKKQLPLFQKM